MLDPAALVDRRAALRAGIELAVTAVLVAACSGGGGEAEPVAPSVPPAAESREVDVTLTLAAEPALGAVGGIVVVGTGLRRVAVVRSGASSFRAFSLVCPHAGGPVGVEDGAFRCPVHGSRFGTDGGLVRGPATVGLQEFAVAVDAGAGTVRVTGRVT